MIRTQLTFSLTQSEARRWSCFDRHLLPWPVRSTACMFVATTLTWRCCRDCPYNHYRTGPDNSPSFFGGMYHVWHWATPYLAVKHPLPASRPGCYAYPDMLGIGAPVEGTAGWAQARAAGCANMSLDEERTLFAVWAIISSPLVLAFDTRSDAVVAKYWPIVTNKRALTINSCWAGSPGQLLKQSSTVTTNHSVPDGALWWPFQPTVPKPLRPHRSD
jgi:hypothetical protein